MSHLASGPSSKVILLRSALRLSKALNTNEESSVGDKSEDTPECPSGVELRRRNSRKHFTLRHSNNRVTNVVTKS